MILKIQRYSLTFAALILFLSGLHLTSCGEKPEEKKQESKLDLDEDYYEFQGVSLKDHEIRALIMLPSDIANIGASKPEIIHAEGDFKWEISVGPNFQLHIEDYGDFTDLVDDKKNKLKEQNLFKIKYLVDEKDLIVYESVLIVRGTKNASANVGFEHKSYHVYGQKLINGITYELRSRDEGYEKSIIELMAKSIKSLKPIKS